MIAVMLSLYAGLEFSPASFFRHQSVRSIREAFGIINYSVVSWGVKTYIDSMYVVGGLLNKPKSYKIKHIFLIDRDSGIQIEEVASKEDGMLNGDAISAMFSAIQSFVQDAFSRDRSSRLTDLTVGDHSIWVSHGPKLMLACVIVGDAPKVLKSDLDHTLQVIQTELIESLTDINEHKEVAGVAEVMRILMDPR